MLNGQEQRIGVIYTGDEYNATREIKTTEYIEWTNFGEPTLKIVKMGLKNDDEKFEDGKPLKDVRFTLKYVGEGEHNGHYVSVDANGNAFYVADPILISTNDKGEIEMKNLPKGPYELKEEESPYGEYSIGDGTPIGFTYNSGNMEVRVKNYEKPENELKILKIGLKKGEDESKGKPLANVGFTLQYADEGEHKGHYVNVDEVGNAFYAEEVITLRTNSEGLIKIKNLPKGNYLLEETEVPDGYTISKEMPMKLTYNSGTFTVKVKNYRKPDDKENKLIISKIGLKSGEDDSKGIPLSDVEFTLKYTGEGEHKNQYVNIDSDGNATFTTQATTLVTSIKGEIVINNLLEGPYELKEIKTRVGYKISGENPIKINHIKGEQVETVRNYEDDNKYEKGSGYVWEDNISGKTSTRNSLYMTGDGDDQDKRLDNVEVTVYSENGKRLFDSTVTMNGGNYSFNEEIKQETIDQYYNGSLKYYVEFKYNGLTYEAVECKPNGSEAEEYSVDRTRINNNFSTIMNNKTRNRYWIGIC